MAVLDLLFTAHSSCQPLSNALCQMEMRIVWESKLRILQKPVWMEGLDLNL